MIAMVSIPPGEHVPTADRQVVLWHVGWDGYESILAVRGIDESKPRISYLDGNVELMAPSRNHEHISYRVGRLLEAFCLARGVRLNGYGNWTLKNQPDEAGVEPDACYCFGQHQDQARPDLAIEVVWTSGGLDKLEIYRRLGVREVWWWKNDAIRVFELVGDVYQPRERSVHLPDIDLELIVELVAVDSLNDAWARMTEAAKR